MRLRSALLALVFVWPALASAQEVAAVRAARVHFQQAHAAAVPQGLTGLQAADPDLSDLHAAHVERDGRTGLTFVRLVQRWAGVDVFGTTSTAAVRATGEVIAVDPRFEAGLAARTNGATPTVPASAAAGAAEAVARREANAQEQGGPPAGLLLTDDAAADRALLTPRPLDADVREPRLGYHPTASGALRLAWETVVTATGPWGAPILRLIRLDAHTGAVLADDDLVVYETNAAGRAGEGRPFTVGLAPVSYAPLRAAAYRVVPFPFESPDRGDFALVSNPADPVASPRGWHDDGSQIYSITRGNNVHAYTDKDSNNEPDPGSSPDGGPALLFDFPFDPDADPSGNAAAAVTNLFYWNNIVHDVTYRYGFNEAAGNFQARNFTGQGAGNDYVLAEALDGTGTGNANFSTPPEGSSPRMQMYRWNGGTQFEVTAPSSAAGKYPARGASFAPSATIEGVLVPTRGPNGETLACSAAEITNDIRGRVALIERGGCNFVDKVLAAQTLGAIGVVIYNRERTGPRDTGGDVLFGLGGTSGSVVIPVVGIARNTGLVLAAATTPPSVRIRGLADRDSGLDAGIVAHEYAHGISNRLIGSPFNVTCLRNGFTSSSDPSSDRPGEQMGEGWSDFYGLILTQQAGDTGRLARGVGTYVTFETFDGGGIRPAAYSTDFAINDYTYQDVISFAANRPTSASQLSIPHGVGFVWAMALWEMTWELINAHGFSEDLYNASGRAGNQIALNLVTTGLKLTPCTPGFVDGRNAILAADQSLYNGAYAPLIWKAFARRGLGVGADQGSASANNDGIADFSTPSDIEGAVSFSEGTVEAVALPGTTNAISIELINERPIAQDFQVDAAALPAWLRLSPTSGTVPARGSVTLTATAQPSPLDVGVLEAIVPVTVGAGTQLLLTIRIATDGTIEGTHALSAVGPNPARAMTRFTLAVAQGQPVEVSLYDTLGRRVSTRTEPFEANVRKAMTLDVSGLASGVYVLHASGETFEETRKITVVR